MPSPSLWHHREFVKLWTGQAISQIGSRITRTALPFAAVITLGAGPIEMGILSGAAAASVLLFGLFAGAWADRLRRRPILIWTDLARAAVLATIPIAAMRHTLTMAHLYVVAAAAGLLTVLFDVSYQAYVPSLVERENILQANAKLALSESVAEVSGPGIAGFLVTALTPPIAILFDAASFLVSALSIALVRKPEPPPEPRKAGAHMGREIVEGLRFCGRNPYLRAMAMRSATAATFMGFFASLYPLFTVKVLNLSPAIIGVVVASGGAFALAGAGIAETLLRRLGFGRAFLCAVLFTNVTTFLHPLAHGSAALCCAFLVAGQLGDFAWPLLNIAETSLRQASAPPRVLGRVNSAMNLLFNGLIPVGAFAGGALAAVIGVRSAMFVGGAGYLLSTFWLVFSPIPALRDLPAATNEATSAVT
jgi:predicted MFS family arabinose efflux permease